VIDLDESLAVMSEAWRMRRETSYIDRRGVSRNQ
jgi:hypothetical protein